MALHVLAGSWCRCVCDRLSRRGGRGQCNTRARGLSRTCRDSLYLAGSTSFADSRIHPGDELFATAYVVSTEPHPTPRASTAHARASTAVSAQDGLYRWDQKPGANHRHEIPSSPAGSKISTCRRYTTSHHETPKHIHDGTPGPTPDHHARAHGGHSRRQFTRPPPDAPGPKFILAVRVKIHTCTHFYCDCGAGEHAKN